MNTTRWTNRTPNTKRLASAVIGGAVAVGVLTAIATPAAAQGMRGGWEPTVGHLTRTLAHVIGVVGGLAMVYFADDIRRKTAGSTVGACALLTEVGTALFVLVFLDMEVGHLLGTGLWSGSRSVGVTRLWWMTALAAMVALYTLSYRTLVRDVGGG